MTGETHTKDNKMTIEEVKRKKAELEVMIKDRLTEFQNDTGVKIADINVRLSTYNTTTDEITYINNVEVKVKL